MSEALGNLDDFTDCCEQQAWFFSEGLIALHTAVDNLQALAELWGLVDELGQDAVQSHMGATFAVVRRMSEQDPLPTDYAAQLVRQWELADPRDAWKHTGELPPPAHIRNGQLQRERPANRRKGPAESTIAAFRYVASLGDAEYLAKWLRDHADYAPALLEHLQEAA